MAQRRAVGADEKRRPAGNRPAKRSRIAFRLYIAKGEASSVRALSNLRAICRDHFDGDCDVEVVDALEDLQRAERDGIAATPTLVRVSPAPGWRIVGDLSEDALILAMMRRGRAQRRHK